MRLPLARDNQAWRIDDSGVATVKRSFIKSKGHPLRYKAPRAGSRRASKAYLDRLVSKITLRGERPCLVCGETDIQLIVAGHLFSRSFPATRFLLENVVPLCSACNLRHEDEPHYLVDAYIARYHRRAYDELEAHHWSKEKPTESELDSLIAEYEEILNQGKARAA